MNIKVSYLLSVFFFLCLQLSEGKGNHPLVPTQIHATERIFPMDYVWDSPSENSAGSMPCGGGDIGLNVWVENGDILVYMAKNGAFDENNTLLKQGRIRIHIGPGPFKENSPNHKSTSVDKNSPKVLVDEIHQDSDKRKLSGNFRQALQLRTGDLSISQGDFKVLIWVDVFKPVIHFELQGKTKRNMLVSYESWRYQDREIRKKESDQSTHKWVLPKGLKTRKDKISLLPDGLNFMHSGPDSTVFDMTVAQQGMESLKDRLYNPLKGRISGGRLICPEFRFEGTSQDIYGDTDFMAWNFIHKETNNSSFEIVLYAEQCNNSEEWESKVNEIAGQISSKKDQVNTRIWWEQVWKRSWLKSGNQSEVPDNKVQELIRNYNLFRYMLACNAYGKWPTRFNGGLFTFDPSRVDKTLAFTPDYRRWTGGTFTAQNQRLVYWPMLKNGDAGWMKPQFDFYVHNLANAEARSRLYWGHSGACFTEQIENFGLPNPSEYGWKRPASYDKGLQYNAWLEYSWDTVLEFCEMILESASPKEGKALSDHKAGKGTHTMTGRDSRNSNNYTKNSDTNSKRDSELSRAYIDLIESSVDFFFEHYAHLAAERGRKVLDQQGHLVFYPGSGAETYKMAYNSTSTIAGLKRVILSLKKYNSEHPGEIRLNLDSLQALLPALEFREINGKAMISPAKLWERANNTEDPQLYPVYPWRFYGIGRSGLDTARNTYLYDPDVLKFRSHVGWKQDLIFAACLGLTSEAKELLEKKMASGPYRFPAFWGPGFDWSPDHNWGGSGMIGMQEMLIQETDEGKIYLFPAWPPEWDIDFKLHLSGNTTVEAAIENGIISKLKVLPAERTKDIILPN